MQFYHRTKRRITFFLFLMISFLMEPLLIFYLWKVQTDVDTLLTFLQSLLLNFIVSYYITEMFHQYFIVHVLNGKIIQGKNTKLIKIALSTLIILLYILWFESLVTNAPNMLSTMAMLPVIFINVYRQNTFLLYDNFLIGDMIAVDTDHILFYSISNPRKNTKIKLITKNGKVYYIGVDEKSNNELKQFLKDHQVESIDTP